MKNITPIFCALFAFAVLSCQNEGETVVQDTSNNFTKSSPISSLISRVSQYETTADNVLDGTSNCSIKLPAHVTVNSQYVYVMSEADFQTVRNIKNQSTTDDDRVHFSYPITMIYPNYYQHSVASEAEFNAIMESYGDDSPYRDISCLDFNYPILINIYNTSNQVASTVTIQNDVQFYSFIHNLNASQIVGIVFPITITNGSSQQITINNNAALENTINEAVIDCNDDPALASLSDILSSGTWHVSYCYHGNDYTGYYNGYNFTFNSNGDCTAVKNSATINGDWDLNGGMPERLDLHFDGDQLHELETNWDVQEYTSTYVRLREHSSPGPGPQATYLSFTKN